jgi:hypothetical protein
MTPTTETTDAKALFRAFVACLIVASLPIKNAAYVTPALYLLILWLHGEARVVRRFAVLCSAIMMISSIAVLWDHLAGNSVNFPGLWIGLLTYAPLFLVLCETFDRTIDQATYEKFARVCAWFILFQSAIGVFQFVATGNSDAVCGTLGLLDGFQHSITITQVYFTFVIFGMILFLVPLLSQWLPRFAIAAGVLTCMLAQSGHQTVFFVVALVIGALFRFSHVGTLVRSIAAATVITLLLLQIYPDTIGEAREWFQKATDTSNSPKQFALSGAATILAQPKNLLIGTGIGQYSSRAALISSDEYLNIKLPLFLTGRSDYYNEHIRPAITLFEKTGEGSAIAKPYMSVISLPVELGLVLTIVLLVVIGCSVVWYVRLMNGRDGQAGWIGFTMMVGIVFFALCCFIENYAEFSQAIFVPFILFIVAGSRAQTILRTAPINTQTKCMSTSQLNGRYGLGAPLRPRCAK